MHQKLTRLAFARLAVAAPMVALALKSDGSREAAAQSAAVCNWASYICTASTSGPAGVLGPCTQNCRYICEPALPGGPPTLYANCPACTSRSC